MREKSARRRGLPVPPRDDDKTEEEETTDTLSSHLLWVWQAFASLSRTRVVNQTGPQPISPSDIQAYCFLENIALEEERRDLLFFLTDLDVLWMKDAHAKINKRQEEAKKEAEKKAKNKRGRGRGRI